MPEEPIASALALDLLRVELGYGLLPLINDTKGHRVTDQDSARSPPEPRPPRRWALVMPAVPQVRTFSTTCSLARTNM